MSTETPEAGARQKRFHIPFYDGVLKVVEVWLLIIMLFLVIGATFLNILDRNFDMGLWEYAVIEKMVYSFTFYIGLFGGVIAARRAKHIAIDAVTHFLSSRVRAVLGVALQFIGFVTCAILSYAAYQWLYGTIDAEVTLLEGRTQWWLKTRLWRWPVLIAFSWMALHFLVNSGRYLYDVINPLNSSSESETGERQSEQGVSAS